MPSVLDTAIALDVIRTDGGTQPRAELSSDYIQDLRAALEDGARLPAVTVFYDGTSHWLADGFHRYHAHLALSKNTIAADVRSGTHRDAILFSVGANASHGLRRTNEDKRRSVLRLLSDNEWSRWSDREIARQCGVSNRFVTVQRNENPSLCTVHSERTYIDKYGNQSVMNVSNIGKQAVTPLEPETVVVTEEKSPLYRKELQVVGRRGGMLECQDEDGATVGVLTTWVETPQTQPKPVAQPVPVQTKPNHLAELADEVDYLTARVQLLEGFIGELLENGGIVPAWTDKARELVGD